MQPGLRWEEKKKEEKRNEESEEENADVIEENIHNQLLVLIQFLPGRFGHSREHLILVLVMNIQQSISPGQDHSLLMNSLHLQW